MRICLDARLKDGQFGGVQQVMIGLADALRKSPGPEEVLFLVYDRGHEWLKPYLRSEAQLLSCGAPPPDPAPRPFRAWISRTFPGLRKAWQQISGAEKRPLPGLPPSDGTIERAGVDVMHFTLQTGFATEIPSIYQPHDLQHLHFPGFFSLAERRRREGEYRALCRQAARVAVMTEWGKTDLLRHYDLPESKVIVIPWAPVLPAYSRLDQEERGRLKARLGLSERFLFYPAQTWPHKNHLALFSALALLRERQFPIQLVCTGHKSEYYHRTLAPALRRLGLDDQVLFPGFLRPEEIPALYEMARALVFPSRFEGWGMPVTEAFSAGLPVACSNATSLPELVKDAALLFPTDDIPGMSQAIERVCQDEPLRRDLIARGRAIAGDLSWEKTAARFLEHYRRLGAQDSRNHARRPAVHPATGGPAAASHG